MSDEFRHRLLELIARDRGDLDLIDHGTSLRASNEASIRGLLDAFRAVATTGARPISAQISPDADSLISTMGAELHLQISVNTNMKPQMLEVGGELDDPNRRTPAELTNDGDLIYLLGGRSKDVDLRLEILLRDIMIAASRDGLLNAAASVSVSGLGHALALMSIAGNKGARFWIPDGLTPEEFLFGDEPTRIICVVPRTEELRFSDMCVARYVPLYRIGVVDGDQLQMQGYFSIDVTDLANAWGSA